MGLLQNRMFVGGVRRFFSGARQGRSGTTAFGLALAIAGFVRARRGADRELLYARNLREGETLRIRFARDGADVTTDGDAPRERGGGQRIR